MGLYKDYLSSLSKKEMINIIYKALPFKLHNKSKLSKKQVGEYEIRKIALSISYDGRNYAGVQEISDGYSIVEALKNALEASGLYVDHNELIFCGRTDAGVSANKMVASLLIKCKKQLVNKEKAVNKVEYTYNNKRYFKFVFDQSEFMITDRDKSEWPFDAILNAYLPKDIRINGWAPVPKLFSARHNCRERTYKYFFILKEKSDEKINFYLKKYREAADIVKGLENFYNLAKHSNSKANYKMKLNYLEFSQIKENFCVMEIRAYSFLHNMVRKIFYYCNRYVETGRTDFDCVKIADPENLMFFDCKYDNQLNFISKDIKRNEEDSILLKGREVKKMLNCVIEEFLFN